MDRLDVLVCGTDDSVCEYLSRSLSPLQYHLARVAPGLPFIRAVRQSPPDIVVIDWARNSASATLAEIEVMIDMIKNLQPRVPIIVRSDLPTMEDGRLVELGLFYYMALAVGPELIQVVEAAARSLPQSSGAGSAS